MIPYRQAFKSFARCYWLAVLKKTQGNVTEAARIAQRNRTQVYKDLARVEIDLQEDLPEPRITVRRMHLGNWGDLWDQP